MCIYNYSGDLGAKFIIDYNSKKNKSITQEVKTKVE